MAYSKIILNGETLMDVTSDTVTSAKMLDGTTATKNDGTKATGSIATKSAANLTASGSTVTVPAGYYSAQATKNVSAGSAFTPAVTITTNPTVGITSSTGVVTASYNGSSSITPTVTAGYVATGTAGTVSTTGTKTLQLTSKAAATYNTSTADQTIGSYQWLTGAQTIKSVTTSNLAAANIKSGVTVKVGDANNASRITQVTGTLKEGTPHTAYILNDGNSSNCYVQHNNTKYYTANTTFTFYDGDTLTFYVKSSSNGGAKIDFGAGTYVNASGNNAATYSYTAIGCDLIISLGYDAYTPFIAVGFVEDSLGTERRELALDYVAISPTEEAQTILPSFSYYGLYAVYINPISSTYVGSGVPKKSSADTTFTSSNGTFTAPSGYYSANATKTVTTQAAQTINTSTADQTIASYRWLTGTQTIKSVTTSNLTAANIASGVTVKVGDANNASRITQVTGTYAPAVSTLTVTPTESQQTFNATGVYGYKPVTVNAISSTYVGTGIARKSSTDTTFNSTTATFTAPIGYYSAAATKVITAQAAQTLYPSTADQTIASYKWLTGTQTIKSVVTSNLTAENIAEGVTVKVGDSSNASRITQITGTHSGEATYTATIKGNGNSTNCYVQKGSTKYSSNGNTFEFHEGDTIILYASADEIYVNGELITPVNHSYTYTLPANDVSIQTLYSTDSNNFVTITNALRLYTCTISGNGSSTYCYITKESNKYYTNGNTFEFYEGNIISLYAYTKNILINGKELSTPVTLYHYIMPASDVSAELTYTNSNINSVSVYGITYPTGTYNISENGSYNIYGYSVASVDIPYYDQYKRITSKLPLYFSSTHSSALSNQAFMNDLTFVRSAQFTGITFETNSAVIINFSNCSKVEHHGFGQWELYLGYSGTLVMSFPICTSFGNNAFLNNTQLLSIYAPNLLYISSSAFSSCYCLKEASFPECISINAAAFQNCSSLTIANFPKCVSIGYFAFNQCTKLNTLSFPLCTLVSSSAFNSCSSLTTANFPECTEIKDYAFNNCTRLATISFPKCTSIGMRGFAECNNLITISFPECTSINSLAFSNCYRLTSVNFSKCITIGSSAFYSCSSLTTVNFPLCTSINTAAFAYCSLALTEVSFPECISAGNYAFQYCYVLSTINLPKCEYIGSGVFWNCSILKTINLSKCSIVNNSAFNNCYSLSVVSLPIISSFGQYAFQKCYNLLSLYLNNVSTVPTYGTNMFNSTPISTYTTSTGGVRGKIYVPSSLYNTFKTATGWTAYSSLMVSM